jgi:hypothetical protein
MLWNQGEAGSKIASVENDEQLVDLWLHDKSQNTQDAYRRDLA